ncbi:hypothetical protein QDS01_17970 [Acinetobacter nosocomialis]|uniref:hypothetical protein n=1 Tax=Acinetobacter nosocomialis TaxID=106654 RepID=UPI0024467F24|nr:hypothetical protein [Acinetobacter nosocomialis]MDH2636799.1 hypothetical protein [Acinetobacter nosocomialis]
MSALQTLSRLILLKKDDGKGAYILFFGNNKTEEKANELIESWLASGVNELRVVNATDEIKGLIKPFENSSLVTYHQNYDEAYDAIFPNA